jgi:2-polyprenyl-3-methyl-5-hydroxy-6-metoxy-1,4-benzoquinol methylase
MEVKTLDIKEKQSVSYCIPDFLRDENIRANIKKVKGRLEAATEKVNAPIAIVCFGGSLKDTWEQVREFDYIITCSGSHKFLLDNGVQPSEFKEWLHCDVDPRLHKLKLLGEPQKGVTYLPASTCHPQYIDYLIKHDADIKLWHVFATQEEGFRVLPRGESLITGGSSVGLRAMTIARILGFTNLHVFGMDGDIKESGSHAAEHPNAIQKYKITELNGKQFKTTESLLHCAKETFHELDMMGDVAATFYGEGLVQELAKEYTPKPLPPEKRMLAFIKPELISEEYKRLNQRLHDDNVMYGVNGNRHTKTVLQLQEATKSKSIGDYGCGKGSLARELAKHDIAIFEHDPCVKGKEEPLPPVDLLVCTDVLEHIEPDKLQFVLDDMRRCCKKVGYLVISTRKAVKVLADGRNAHLIVKDKHWWRAQLKQFFTVGKIFESKDEIHVIVTPKMKSK